MNRILILIWYWCLVIFPLTSLITFVLTLVVCSQVPHRQTSRKLPEISVLGTGDAYRFFVSGFSILVFQILIIFIGRLKYLVESKSIIYRIIVYVIHLVGLISTIFMLIMSIVSIDHNGRVHLIGAIGLFSCLSFYCLSHTIVVLYLFIRRSKYPKHSNKYYPIWFLLTSILLIVFFIVWGATTQSIPQYIAAASPFLYILGFIPQFYKQVKIKRQDTIPVESTF